MVSCWEKYPCTCRLPQLTRFLRVRNIAVAVNLYAAESRPAYLKKSSTLIDILTILPPVVSFIIMSQVYEMVSTSPLTDPLTHASVWMILVCFDADFCFP